MEIKINIEKRHLYFLSMLIILLGSLLLVQGAVSNPGPSHNANQIYLESGGTLMDAINDGSLSSGSVSVSPTIYVDKDLQVGNKIYMYNCPSNYVLTGLEYNSKSGQNNVKKVRCSKLVSG